jgi:hypothetical protein
MSNLPVAKDPEALAKACETLRVDHLFNERIENGVVLGPIAEQHYLLALAALEQAARFAKLANYYAMRRK